MSSISATPSFVSQRVERFNMTPSLRTYYPKHETFLDRISRFCSKAIPSWLSTQNSPIKIGGFAPKSRVLDSELVVFGDIHGEFFGLIENLMNASLIDEKGNWSESSKTLVQLGDVIDRGYASEAIWEYLALLQTQAEKSLGKVVRLIGNHELMLLEGFYGYAERVIADPPAFAKKVKEDILAGHVQLAYTDGKRLFLHAGMRTEIRDLLVREIMKQKNCEAQEVYVEDIVDYLNELLIQAVEKEDFSHPIFHVGVSRGGQYAIGGVLWESLSEIAHSKRALDIPQVVGHNPPRAYYEPSIRVTSSQRLIEVDAGLNPIYGGRQAYVVFDRSDIAIRAKDKKADRWMEWIAKDLLKRSNTLQESSRSEISP